MKLVIYKPDSPPIEIEVARVDRVSVMCGRDHFELREQVEHGGDQSLIVRLEEHDGKLGMDLALFPNSANSVRLKGFR